MSVCSDRATDFLCQLRRHTLQHYGQHRGGILADADLQRELRGAIQRHWTRTNRHDLDDALLDAMPVTWGPAAVRRFLAVPRCTNTASLYVFLLLDALVYFATVKVVRFLQRKYATRPADEDERFPQRHLRRHWRSVPLWVAFVVTLVAVKISFRLLRRWMEEPHSVLTLCITGYLFVYTYLDSLVPAQDVLRSCARHSRVAVNRHRHYRKRTWVSSCGSGCCSARCSCSCWWDDVGTRPARWPWWWPDIENASHGCATPGGSIGSICT